MSHILTEQAKGIVETDPWYVAALSNLSALIMENMDRLNWVGFYLMRDGRLVVGPFQGKVACIHIKVGNGVCGTCVMRDETVVVPDVHAFPGHIACDSASRSEIVVPIHHEGKVIGVLDIDSPEPDRFSEEDRVVLESLVKVIETGICWE